MKSTASLQGAVPTKGTEYRAEFVAKFNEYLATQHPIVRGLHLVLKGLAMICFVLPFIFGVIAFYQTFVWATTGDVSSLGIAWANFGFSCSFMVFFWGLDAMLMRAFPTGAFLVYAYGTVKKPIRFTTGLGAFFAGFGIMCAGAPGAATIPAAIWQFVLSLI
jgi:hypothetical protein